jgi:2-polyprenyl-3-methyl-5-hydroxy-6-metoxy-1,4-benzoquinol methylase
MTNLAGDCRSRPGIASVPSAAAFTIESSPSTSFVTWLRESHVVAPQADATPAGMPRSAARAFYNRNNPAKQWILEQIARLSASGPIRVCDLACGDGSAWPGFLRDHPSVQYLGVDWDEKAIRKAKQRLAGIPNATAEVGNGQTFRSQTEFDVVTALSSMEHVPEPGAFVASALEILGPAGRLYLNYDAGHFKDATFKERLLVPLGRLLAKLGNSHHYLREVRDDELRQLVEGRGGRIVEIRKHNLDILKRKLRDDVLTDEATRLWHDFESSLNEQLAPGVLGSVFWSTVMVVEHRR